MNKSINLSFSGPAGGATYSQENIHAVAKGCRDLFRCSQGRQVKDAQWGLTQNMGGTGASSVVHIFARA